MAAPSAVALRILPRDACTAPEPSRVARAPSASGRGYASTRTRALVAAQAASRPSSHSTRPRLSSEVEPR